MKKYISKDYINNILNKYLDRWCGPEHYACNVIKDELNNTPNSETIFMQECPACGGLVDTDMDFRFCPYCGEPVTEEI